MPVVYHQQCSRRHFAIVIRLNRHTSRSKDHRNTTFIWVNGSRSVDVNGCTPKTRFGKSGRTPARVVKSDFTLQQHWASACRE